MRFIVRILALILAILAVNWVIETISISMIEYGDEVASNGIKQRALLYFNGLDIKVWSENNKVVGTILYEDKDRYEIKNTIKEFANELKNAGMTFDINMNEL